MRDREPRRVRELHLNLADLEAAFDAERDRGYEPPFHYVNTTQYDRILTLVSQGVNEYIAIYYGAYGGLTDAADLPERYRP